MSDEEHFRRLKRLAVAGFAATIATGVALYALQLLIDYEIQKHAVKNGIKDAAKDGVFAQPQRQAPVVVMSPNAGQAQAA